MQERLREQLTHRESYYLDEYFGMVFGQWDRITLRSQSDSNGERVRIFLSWSRPLTKDLYIPKGYYQYGSIEYNNWIYVKRHTRNREKWRKFEWRRGKRITHKNPTGSFSHVWITEQYEQTGLLVNVNSDLRKILLISKDDLPNPQEINPGDLKRFIVRNIPEEELVRRLGEVVPNIDRHITIKGWSGIADTFSREWG